MQTKVAGIIEHSERTPGALIPILRAIQDEYRYLPKEALKQVATSLKLPFSHVNSVATFYSMFSFKPRGRYIIRACTNAPCYVNRGTNVLRVLKKELGIKLNETTLDGKFTLESTECVGTCQMTPRMTINGKLYGDLTPIKIKSILSMHK
jgi:NADH-quinone oxidoreductase subunit E